MMVVPSAVKMGGTARQVLFNLMHVRNLVVGGGSTGVGSFEAAVTSRPHRGVHQQQISRKQLAKAEMLLHLNHLSKQLFIESSHNEYSYLRPPQTYRELKGEESGDDDVTGDVMKYDDVIAYWNEVLGIAHEMCVVPEMADQLSGAIYMHALMQEDICTKCIRLSDFVHKLTRQDILDILNNIGLWSLNLTDIHKSDMLQLLLGSLDRFAFRSLANDLRLTFAFCNVLRFFRAKNCNYVGRTFDGIRPDSREQIVAMMLVSAYCHNSTNAPIKVDQDLMRLLAVQINLMFEALSPSELAVCYSGLQCAPCPEVDQLGQKIIGRYGFRL